jgi:glycosyltransferase involved in cell wall biosynthesis
MLENPENSEYRLALSQVAREAGDNTTSFNHFKTLFDEHRLELCNFESTGENMEVSVENLARSGGEDIDGGPLVSVIMTAYKATELVEIAINSILNQTYQNLELIVVDDASPDDTFEYIQKLAEGDSRIRPIKLEKNGGTYIAKNHGLLIATGDYVTFHDSDDWCHPDKIRIQVDRLQQNQELMGMTTGYIRVDENSNIIYRGKGSIRHACISLMIRRKEIIEIIGFFDSVRVSADSEFERRIHAVFGKEAIEHIELPLIIASVRSESLSGGGKFALDWTGLSGPRLQYRQQFESYHDRIRIEKEGGYMPFPLKKRVFNAPKDMVW